MILGELGYLLVIFCTSLMICNMLYQFYQMSFRKTEVCIEKLYSIYFLAMLSILGAFILLLLSFVCDDFGLKYVWANSSKALPIFYKIASLWSGHEGSWILWTLISVCYAFCMISDMRSQPEKGNFNSTQISLMLAFYCVYSLFASNPFVQIFPIAPGDGMDANPLLQDIALLIHPPCLYMGNCGLLVVYGLSLNLLKSERKEFDMILYELISSWSLWSWGWLTVGMTIGSWWAYRELGWGGFGFGIL